MPSGPPRVDFVCCVHSALIAAETKNLCLCRSQHMVHSSRYRWFGQYLLRTSSLPGDVLQRVVLCHETLHQSPWGLWLFYWRCQRLHTDSHLSQLPLAARSAKSCGLRSRAAYITSWVYSKTVFALGPPWNWQRSKSLDKCRGVGSICCHQNPKKPTKCYGSFLVILDTEVCLSKGNFSMRLTMGALRSLPVWLSLKCVCS